MVDGLRITNDEIEKETDIDMRGIPDDADPKDYCQILTITLDSGEEISFLGKAFTMGKEDVTIVDFKISSPKKLPPGTKLSTMN